MAAFYAFSNHKKRMSPQVEAIDRQFKQGRERDPKDYSNRDRQSLSLDCRPDRSHKADQRLISQAIIDNRDSFSGSALSALDEVMAGVRRSGETPAPSDTLIDCLVSDHNESGGSSIESYLKDGFYSERTLVFDRENGYECSLMAALDTGCKTGNYVSEDIVKYLGKRIYDLGRDSQRGFSATYHEVKVIGVTKLFYSVESWGTESEFFVAKGSKMGLILGDKELHEKNWLLLGRKNASVQPIYPMRRSDKLDKSNKAAKAQQKAEVEKAEEERRKQAADDRRARMQMQRERGPSSNHSASGQ